MPWPRTRFRRLPLVLVVVAAAALLVALIPVLVSGGRSDVTGAHGATAGRRSERSGSVAGSPSRGGTPSVGHPPVLGPRAEPLPAPLPLASFGAPAAGEGAWTPAGRVVDGQPAVYQTSLVPPGGGAAAGIAWMDTHLLAARLYSGSVSPGGGPYAYTAPVEPAQAASLVAAFNGGFKMADAGGGYYTEGRVIDPLVTGAASLVVYSDGSVDVGAWGTDVTMTPQVVSVRQNLVPLVADGVPTPLAAGADWQAWGNTCGATSCSSTVPGVEAQWRSGVGVTADGALVYVTGPTLAPLQLAALLARAGVVRGMELDINPYWTVFASYDPPPGVSAAPANGTRLVASTVQGPATFFEPAWARDFVTLSARPAPVAGTVAFPAPSPGG